MLFESHVREQDVESDSASEKQLPVEPAFAGCNPGSFGCLEVATAKKASGERTTTQSSVTSVSHDVLGPKSGSGLLCSNEKMLLKKFQNKSSSNDVFSLCSSDCWVLPENDGGALHSNTTTFEGVQRLRDAQSETHGLNAFATAAFLNACSTFESRVTAIVDSNECPRESSSAVASPAENHQHENPQLVSVSTPPLMPPNGLTHPAFLEPNSVNHCCDIEKQPESTQDATVQNEKLLLSRMQQRPNGVYGVSSCKAFVKTEDQFYFPRRGRLHSVCSALPIVANEDHYRRSDMPFSRSRSTLAFEGDVPFDKISFRALQLKLSTPSARPRSNSGPILSLPMIRSLQDQKGRFVDDLKSTTADVCKVIENLKRRGERRRRLATVLTPADFAQL